MSLSQFAPNQGKKGLGICEFYRDKTILITGSTGFVGKVVLDKIIRMQPNFRKIYVMIREKKNMSLAERFEQQIFSSELFQPLFQR